MSYQRQRRMACLLAAAPATGFLLLQAWPLASAAASALSGPEGEWSLEPIRRVYGDPLFRRSIYYSLLVPVASVALEASVGLTMALWFYEFRRGKTFWRTVAIIPFAVPEIVYLLTMKLVFRQHGYLNSLLVSMGGRAVGWLDPDSHLMVAMIILIDAWRVTPVVFLIVLTALEQLPVSYVEAARLDGANRIQVAARVLTPLIVPALLVALALRAVDAFRIFATPLVLVGVNGLPVLTSVAYHYQEEAHDPAAANVAALTLALALAVLAAVALAAMDWRRRARA